MIAAVDCLQPYLKYPGNKRDLIDTFLPYWEPHRHRRLVEWCCGSAAVALGFQPERALLNDANPHVINLHRQVQSGLNVTLEMKYDRDYFHQCRDRFNGLIRSGNYETPEAAQLFYLLSKSGFNGLIRFNSQNPPLYNVSFGKYKAVNYLSDFAPWERAFKNWEFTCLDFAKVPLEPEDFVYSDPPYDELEEEIEEQEQTEETQILEQLCLFVSAAFESKTVPAVKRKRSFTTYNGVKFDWERQVEHATALADHPGPVLTSNAATDRIVDLYDGLGFDIAIIEVKRSISNNGDRTPVKEIVAFKPPDKLK